MLPFRVVVVDSTRLSSSVLVQLDRSPDIGATLDLPHGRQVVVQQVLTADHDRISGVVLAAPV